MPQSSTQSVSTSSLQGIRDNSSGGLRTRRRCGRTRKLINGSRMSMYQSTKMPKTTTSKILFAIVASLLILLSQDQQQYLHPRWQPGIIKTSSHEAGRGFGGSVLAFSTLLTTAASMEGHPRVRRSRPPSSRQLVFPPATSRLPQPPKIRFSTSTPTDATVLVGRQVDPRRHAFRLATSPQDDDDMDGGDDDDDDGWGSTTSSTSASSKSMDEMTEELRSLQTPKRSMTSNTVQNQNQNQRQDEQEQERDLFIPVFAVVSLMGLFGSYGYEMLRLYSRGELYLPWMDN